jgi:RimJ/RimL family protein N-acetyltransferase
MVDYGHGVSLQSIAREDLPQMLKWRNDLRIWQWCRQYEPIHPVAHEKWYERQASDPKLSMFKIMTAKGGFIGVCGFTDIDLVNRRAEFSLYVGPEYHGKGYGQACLKTLFTHGFKNLGLNVIWGETFFGNSAANMFEKIGMKKEGVRRQFYFRDGRFIDATLYSITASEWT